MCDSLSQVASESCHFSLDRATLLMEMDQEDTSIYLLTVGFMAVLAVLLFVIDEARGTRPKTSSAFWPLFYPDESIPWANLNHFEYFSGMFGLGIRKEAILEFVSQLVRKAPGIASSDRSGKEESPGPVHKDELAWTTTVHAYMGFAILFLKGFAKEVLWTVTFSKNKNDSENWNAQWWKEFYTQHMYRRIEDCWNRPIASAPGSTLDVVVRSRDDNLLKRFSNFHTTGDILKGCINLASYNYLGYGGHDEYCTPQAIAAVKEFGLSVGATRAEAGGTNRLHVQLEALVASFMGKEDALVMGMGFATNSTVLAAIALTADATSDKKTLFVSDALNHKSIVEGVKQSNAKVMSFKHNDVEDLERILDNETRSGKWAKIVIIVEGIYSMEGEFCRLREIVTLKHRYNCYLWVDEAHSIGAVGASGKGVCELFGVDTSSVDMLMGTFTKSFGSNGGYIAADKANIDFLRSCAVGWIHGSSMIPMCTAQTIAALQLLETPRGKQKLLAVRDNSNYFRRALMDLKLTVLGDIDSPVICALIVHPEKIAQFSRECLKRNVATVVVGFPATPVLLSRARFCVSASHTREQMDYAAKQIGEVAKLVGIEYDRSVSDAQSVSHRELLSNAPLETTRLAELSTYWTPEPLSPHVPLQLPRLRLHRVSTAENASTASGGSESADATAVVDFSINDPLSLIVDPMPEVQQKAITLLEAKGVGACGPRGFYGTTIEHLELEKTIAEFLETQAAIVYSHHVVTASSVVQAFVTPGDSVIVHKLAGNGLHTGLKLARVKNVTVWSGDLDELTELVEAKSKTIQLGSRPARLWIVMDSHYGVDLRQVVDIKKWFGAYLLLDDSIGMGTVGVTGRGYCEHYGVHCSAVDLLVGSLEHAFGSVGGFCAGQQTSIDHQTLYGSGYCFSASSPPAAAKAAAEAIRVLPSSDRLARLQANVKHLHDSLLRIGAAVVTDELSFVQLVKVADASAFAQHMQEAGFVVQPVLSSPLESGGLAAESSGLVKIAVGAHHKKSTIDDLLEQFQRIM